MLRVHVGPLGVQSAKYVVLMRSNNRESSPSKSARGCNVEGTGHPSTDRPLRFYSLVLVYFNGGGNYVVYWYVKAFENYRGRAPVAIAAACIWPAHACTDKLSDPATAAPILSNPSDTTALSAPLDAHKPAHDPAPEAITARTCDTIPFTINRSHTANTNKVVEAFF